MWTKNIANLQKKQIDSINNAYEKEISSIDTERIDSINKNSPIP